MGQTTSLDIASEDKAGLTQRKQTAESNRAIKMSSVTHKEVANCIQELNAVTSGFSDRTGKQLRFIIRKGTDNSVFWKRTIRIYCQKLSTNTNVIETSRQLSLRQFLRLHQEIIGQISALTKKYEDFLTNNNSKLGQKTSNGKSLNSSAFNASPKKTELSMQIKKECCACMERMACLLLSCDHEFCEICIDSWIRDDEDGNCPLCRPPVPGEDVKMAVTDNSDSKDYKSEIREYLMRLAERKSKRVN